MVRLPAAFAIPEVNLSLVQVQILCPQLQCFQKAQAAPVKQPSDEGNRAVELVQDGADLLAREYHGKPLGPLCPYQIIHPRQPALEHLAVEEQQRREGLVLRAGADSANRCDHRPGTQMT